MPEQLRLEGTEVPSKVRPIRPATVALGLASIAKCRAILANATEVQETA